MRGVAQLASSSLDRPSASQQADHQPADTEGACSVAAGEHGESACQSHRRDRSIDDSLSASANGGRGERRTRQHELGREEGKKKAEHALKEWKSDERKRVRKEVTRRIFAEQQISMFDPFTILTILSLIIRVLSFLFEQYGLN